MRRIKLALVVSIHIILASAALAGMQDGPDPLGRRAEARLRLALPIIATTYYDTNAYVNPDGTGFVCDADDYAACRAGCNARGGGYLEVGAELADVDCSYSCSFSGSASPWTPLIFACRKECGCLFSGIGPSQSVALGR